MKLNNPIVYYEEDGIECITNCGNGKIVNMTPNVDEDGHIVSIELFMENCWRYGTYYTSYQKSFKFRFLDGQEVKLKGKHGDVDDDKEFNKKFLQFVEDFHNGKYESSSNFQVINEVEFMDI